MLEQIEELVEKIEKCPDPPVREMARHLVQSILALNGEALGRVIEMCEKEVGRDFVDLLAGDPKIAPLLLLYGIHPEEVGRRVERALESVRPYLNSHGGSVELIGVEEGTVRVRLQGSCLGCPSSVETLKGTIEEAVLSAAPDTVGIEVL